MKALLVFVLLSFCLGLGKTAAGENMCLKCHDGHYRQQGDCVYCHRGNPLADREKIAHYRLIEGKHAYFRLKQSLPVQQGKEIISKQACRRCHRIAQKGNDLAANLENLKDSRPDELYLRLKDPAYFMPDFSFYPYQINQIINALLAQAYRFEPTEKIVNPRVIHFKENTDSRKKLIEKHCGSCHKILTKNYGGLGFGEIGPNLSGLFSPFYTRKSPGADWNSSTLKKWIKNPRSNRKSALMPPISLNNKKLENLVKTF